MIPSLIIIILLNDVISANSDSTSNLYLGSLDFFLGNDTVSCPSLVDYTNRICPNGSGSCSDGILGRAVKSRNDDYVTFFLSTFGSNGDLNWTKEITIVGEKGWILDRIHPSFQDYFIMISGEDKDGRPLMLTLTPDGDYYRTSIVKHVEFAKPGSRIVLTDPNSDYYFLISTFPEDFIFDMLFGYYFMLVFNRKEKEGKSEHEMILSRMISRDYTQVTGGMISHNQLNQSKDIYFYVLGHEVFRPHFLTLKHQASCWITKFYYDTKKQRTEYVWDFTFTLTNDSEPTRRRRMQQQQQQQHHHQSSSFSRNKQTNLKEWKGYGVDCQINATEIIELFDTKDVDLTEVILPVQSLDEDGITRPYIARVNPVHADVKWENEYFFLDHWKHSIIKTILHFPSDESMFALIYHYSKDYKYGLSFTSILKIHMNGTTLFSKAPNITVLNGKNNMIIEDIGKNSDNTISFWMKSLQSDSSSSSKNNNNNNNLYFGRMKSNGAFCSKMFVDYPLSKVSSQEFMPEKIIVENHVDWYDRILHEIHVIEGKVEYEILTAKNSKDICWSCKGHFFKDDDDDNNHHDDVCSGHGTCKKMNLCYCYEGYSEMYCSQWQCNGINQTDLANVCTGHGICKYHDFCHCGPGYNGTWCNSWLCYGFGNHDKETCYGHGNCTRSDHCRCEKHYFGENTCDNWKCGEYDRFNSNVCSGEGNCEKYDDCECKENYLPPKCTKVECHGKPFDDKDVCSGHGNCTYSDHCVCNFPYSGDECKSLSYVYSVIGIVVGSVTGGILIIATVSILFLICCFFFLLCMFLVITGLTTGVLGQYYGSKKNYIDLDGDLHPLIQAENLLIQSSRGGRIPMMRRSARKNLGLNNREMWKREIFKKNSEDDGVEDQFVIFIQNVKTKKTYLEYEGGLVDQKKSGVGCEYYLLREVTDKNEVLNLRGGGGDQKNLDQDSSVILIENDKKKEEEEEEEYDEDRSLSSAVTDERDLFETVSDERRDSPSSGSNNSSNNNNNKNNFKSLTTSRKFQVRFEGEFLDDERNGRGIEFSKNGKKMLQGVWKNGKIVKIERDFLDLPEVDLSKIRCGHQDILGRGAEGVVYRIEYNDEVMAMKVLNEASDPVQRVMQMHYLLRSQSIWSTVHTHPNILELRGWSGREFTPRGYLMELCKYSLSDFITEVDVSIENKVRILYQIASTMFFLHKKSIMHRDLKMGNILLDHHMVVKVCDFECCRYDDDDWRLRASEKSSLIGSPHCVAPEVIMGNRYSKSCDVYSYGILLYCVYFSVINPYMHTSICQECKLREDFGDADITHHVYHCGLRPSVNKSLLMEEAWLLEELMPICLDRDPTKRPSFEEITKLFKKKVLSKK